MQHTKSQTLWFPKILKAHLKQKNVTYSLRGSFLGGKSHRRDYKKKNDLQHQSSHSLPAVRCLIHQQQVEMRITCN